MAQKRGVAVGNKRGFIGAIGIRYLYSKPKGQQTLGAVASQNLDVYNTVLSSVQRVSNAVARCITKWGTELTKEVQAMQDLIMKVK